MNILKLKTFLFMFLLLALLPEGPVSAAELLVTVKGEAILIKESRKDAGNLAYVDEKDGKEKTIPLPDVSAVIPVMDKKKTYSPEAVEKTLKLIEATRFKHIGLTKNLNVIRDEWATLLKADPNFERKINEEVQQFVSEQPTDVEYSKVMMNLEMMKFKDVSGTHADKIKQAMADVKKAYFGVNLQEFAARADAAKLSIEDLKNMTEVARRVMEKGSAEEQQLVRNTLTKARTRVLNELTPYARTIFKRDGSLGSYLRGKTVLSMLMDVAGTEEEKESVRKESEEVSKMAKDSLKAVDFSYHEFPLFKSDIKLLETCRAYSSTNTLKYVKVADEWAYIIPRSVPVCTGVQGTLTMPFEVVFSKTPVYPTEYSLMLAGIRYRKLFKYNIPLTLKIVDGHADVQLKTSLSKICVDVFPFTSDEGKHLYFYMAARERPKNGDDDSKVEWIPISQGCKIPVATTGE